MALSPSLFLPGKKQKRLCRNDSAVKRATNFRVPFYDSEKVSPVGLYTRSTRPRDLGGLEGTSNSPCPYEGSGRPWALSKQ